MCGIAAQFSYSTAAPAVDREELRRVRDHMALRGPDASGEWFSEDGRVGLAHRRLSIIDLSERGAQPMRSADGMLAITFNGEIYNYQELKAVLAADGVTFRSDSDTEVLLLLYARHGKDMVRMLRGMFAFALYDEREGTMLLARDPYGIKPLYYADEGGSVRIASQVKALIAGGRVSDAVDPAGAVGFLLLGSVPEPFTVRRAVCALPAGSTMMVTSRGCSSPEQFFSIAQTLAEAAANPLLVPEAELYARVREALLDSVTHHMIADVPVGAFLSAGIDSGALVGLARDSGVRDLQTITLAFDEFRGLPNDEAPLAEEVARSFGTVHRTRHLGIDEFNADLPRIFAAMDQPSIDGINTYFVSKAAAEQGLKVALSGLGGDELFAGYNTFVDVPNWVRRFSLPASIPLLGRAFRAFYSTVLAERSSRSPKPGGALLYGGTYPGAWYLRRGVFLPWELESMLPKAVVREGLERLALLDTIEAAMAPDPQSVYGRVAALESSLYMRNQLLRDTDWAGMAHSIELRVPLVDAQLLSTLAPLLAPVVLEHRKRLLALSPTQRPPDHILQRAKTGFQVPVHRWLEQNPDLGAWRSLPSLAREHCPWNRRWAYTILKAYL
jgi:asparagine synthase (glutamine-hydrolysing)